MTSKKKAFNRLKIISLFGVSQILGIFSILVLSLFIVKFHSVALWGYYAELLIWTNLILLFLSFGNQDYLLKSFSNNPATIYQQWTNSLFSRSLLLLPSIAVVFFINAFKDLEIWIILLILLQFLTQSFKVLIVYHRKYTFNIWVELCYNVFIFGGLLLKFESLNISQLLQIIVIAFFIRLVFYSLFLLKDCKKITFQIQVNEFKTSLPFFIPLALGTIRTKVDSYYGTHFFNAVTLSKYQIFISFMMLAQMASAFVITPYLKNFYRSNNSVLKSLQKQFFIFGWLFALIFMGAMYCALTLVYGFQFSAFQYLLAFIFIVPLYIHVLLINEYYKKNLQHKIALFAFIVVLIQLIFGYFIIKHEGINGALVVKAIGQWGIVAILWLWLRKSKING